MDLCFCVLEESAVIKLEANAFRNFQICCESLKREAFTSQNIYSLWCTDVYLALNRVRGWDFDVLFDNFFYGVWPFCMKDRSVSRVSMLDSRFVITCRRTL